MFSEFILFKHLVEKVWQTNRLVKGLSIVTILLWMVLVDESQTIRQIRQTFSTH